MKFLDIWQNKKYRSLIILGIYIIFFLIIALYFNRSVPIEKTGLDLFESISSYKINDDISTEEYNLFTPKNIYKMINNSILESTNYINDNNSYIIKKEKFNSLFSANYDSDIRIITYGKDITKVEVFLPDKTIILEVK